MVDGKKRVEHIPEEWVEQIRPTGSSKDGEFKDAVAEIFAANAQLLALWRLTVEEEEGQEEVSGRRLCWRVGFFG